MIDRLVRVIRKPSRQLVPVAVGTSSASIEGWNRNRRGGPVTDKELTVTRVDTLAGKPLAVLVNFTAHPTFMSEHDMQFSGDWPGHLQRTLESLIGPGVTAMYYNGAEGDQSPQDRPDSGTSRWERAERYGRDLGIVAWRQWQETKTQPDVAFAYHLHTIPLPDRTWHPDFMKTGRQGIRPERKAVQGNAAGACSPPRPTASRCGWATWSSSASPARWPPRWA